MNGLDKKCVEFGVAIQNVMKFNNKHYYKTLGYGVGQSLPIGLMR